MGIGCGSGTSFLRSPTLANSQARRSNRPTPSSTLTVYATTARLPRQDCREADQDIRREVRGLCLARIHHLLDSDLDGLSMKSARDLGFTGCVPEFCENTRWQHSRGPYVGEIKNVLESRHGVSSLRH
jgi:hypothetical protein